MSGCCYAECHLCCAPYMLSAVKMAFMLNVIMLGFIMLSVMAPQIFIMIKCYKTFL
jgi:hypothetical protein